MREDSLDATATDHLLTTPSNEAITRLEGQIASLTAETASLRQTLHQQHDRPRQPFQQHPRQHQRQWQPPQPRREGRPTQPRRKECLWCGRRGHEEAECHNKKRYQQRTRVNQATEVTSKTQLKGHCPTTNITINGKLVPALLDTGSEVTTVTDTWANKNLQGLKRQNCHLALRGVDGTEVPYAGIIIVDVSVLGQLCRDVPIFIVKEPTDRFTQQRKKQLPVLVGMNILGTCLSKAPDIPPCLEAVVREVRLDHISTRGLARTTSHCVVVPANSMATVPVTGNQQTTSHLLASPLAQPLPGGLMVIPTLVSKDHSSRYIRVANLTQEDCHLPARTPIAVLHAVEPEDSHQDDIAFTAGVRELIISREPRAAQSPQPASISCPDFDGTADQRERLQQLLNKHATAFTKDDSDFGYTDAVHHRIRTTDPKPVTPPAS